MSITNEILLELIFPQFTRPKVTRFEKLFVNLKKNPLNKIILVSNEVYPSKVIQGEDKRTTLIMKNIPKNTKKKEIRQMIEQFGNINFLGLLPDKENNYFISAYLNVINYKSIVPIFMGLRKHKFHYYDTDINIEILYSNIQGKEELKKLFNDS